MKPILPLALQSATLSLLVACGGEPIAIVEPGPTARPHFEPDPHPLGDQVIARLELGSAQSELIGHRLSQIELIETDAEVSVATCEGVQVAMWEVCGEKVSSGALGGCSPHSAFFYAHDVPRCAVRIETREAGWTYGDPEMGDILAIDFAGPPLSEPAPLCGNGILDENEMCDDGNHQSWDGCDVTCHIEEFNGCEQVIQHHYEQAGLAVVDKDAWAGQRSHLMTNRGEALVDMDADHCRLALETAHQVCDRLAVEMPFVGGCHAQTELIGAGDGAACAVRIETYFSSLDPERAVFTTALSGLLSFTIQ